MSIESSLTHKHFTISPKGTQYVEQRHSWPGAEDNTILAGAEMLHQIQLDKQDFLHCHRSLLRPNSHANITR